jgi:uncharacterized protein
MPFKDRLLQLQSGAGVKPAPGPDVPVQDTPQQLQRGAGVNQLVEPGSERPDQNALIDRLERLSHSRSAHSPRLDRSSSDAALADLLRGKVAARGVILVETSVALSCCHGSRPLSSIRDTALNLLGNGTRLDPTRLLFLDTETTGLAGGTGTLPFLLGLATIHGDVLSIRQYLLTGFAGEALALQEALARLEGIDYLVTFNGKTFDLPLLAARHRLARLHNPLLRLGHVDLLHPTRCAFARNWPDCRLQTVEQRLLEFFRREDLPGALIPQAWFDLVRHARTEQIPGIMQHNLWDLISLVALLPQISVIHSEPGHQSADPLAIARRHLRNGDAESAYSHLAHSRNRSCEAGQLELAALQRKKGHWEDAAAIWRELAADGSLRACEHLAKYYEHRLADMDAALSCTQDLLERDVSNPAYQRRHARLKEKLQRGT